MADNQRWKSFCLVWFHKSICFGRTEADGHCTTMHLNGKWCYNMKLWCYYVSNFRKLFRILYLFCVFPAHAKNGPRWPPMGPGGFFPTNPDLADIVGRTDFDFENFYLLDFFGSQLGPGLGPACPLHIILSCSAGLITITGLGWSSITKDQISSYSYSNDLLP